MKYLIENPWLALFVIATVATVFLFTMRSIRMKRITLFWPVAAIIGLGLFLFILVNQV